MSSDLPLAAVELQPLPGPEWERVMVAGWQPRSGNVAGYWWWHEDALAGDGLPTERAHATHWFPILLPAFPAPRERGVAA